jgi:hypothetical protein
MQKDGIKINFAHQTFKWTNEAKGKAAVYCVIIGFALLDHKEKKIFYYSDAAGVPTEKIVKQINPYLVDSHTVFIVSRKTPLCPVSEMVFGSMPNDGGHLLLKSEEKNRLLKEAPEARRLIRPFAGAAEFVNGIPRFCIWLKDIPPSAYQKIKPIMERIKKVKEHRLASKRETTVKLGDFPALFGEIRQPESDYLLIPEISTNKRRYIPIGYMKRETVASNLNVLVPNATLYEFGILTSSMHMAWARYVCGRLGNGLRYSASIVYNNFPWPKAATAKQKEVVEKAAQGILDARAQFSDESLANLYDPLTMPPKLVKAHQRLDKAVEAAYGKTFASDADRVAHLFQLYQTLTDTLTTAKKKVRR